MESILLEVLRLREKYKVNISNSKTREEIDSVKEWYKIMIESLGYKEDLLILEFSVLLLVFNDKDRTKEYAI